MDSTRKKKEPTEIHIKRAMNGGYVVRHSYDNVGGGEGYMPDSTHAFGDHKSMMTHVHAHTGGSASKDTGDNGAGSGDAGKKRNDALPGQNSGKVNRTNVGSQRAGFTGNRNAKPPSRRTYGAGVD